MDDLREEKKGWMPVPQFGAWDEKHDMPDYSVDFTRIRESRKQNKKGFLSSSINSEEKIARPRCCDNRKSKLPPQPHQQENDQKVKVPIRSPRRRKKAFSVLRACIKALFLARN